MTDKRPSVLVVEDSATQAEHARLIFESDGFEVAVARNAEEALRLQKERSFDAVISDVVMPGLSGFDLFRRIRTAPTGGDIPLVLLTTLADPRFLIEGIECGADAFVVKPFSPSYLLERVRAVISASQRGPRGGAGGDAAVLGERGGQIVELLRAAFEDLSRSNRRLEESQNALLDAKRRAEENARALEKTNKELEQFAYVASHDLQEPLRKVNIYADLLRRQFADSPQAGKYIDALDDAAVRMRSLIQDLLAYSHVGHEAARREDVDLNAVIAQVVSDLETTLRERNGRVDAAPLPRVKAVPLQMAQIFQNLISNALKYNRSEQPTVWIDAQKDGGMCRVSVRDNGIGIQPGFEERIFGVFQRLKEKKDEPGTGIGLAICKKIVEGHGGKIWIESRPGEGSTFRFTLPT